MVLSTVVGGAVVVICSEVVAAAVALVMWSEVAMCACPAGVDCPTAVVVLNDFEESVTPSRKICSEVALHR